MTGASRGLYQCPSCGGPSSEPGQCLRCLDSLGEPLIQWPPEPDWPGFTVPLTEVTPANLAAAYRYGREVLTRWDDPAVMAADLRQAIADIEASGGPRTFGDGEEETGG
jgi:hypothetical protein